MSSGSILYLYFAVLAGLVCGYNNEQFEEVILIPGKLLLLALFHNFYNFLTG